MPSIENLRIKLVRKALGQNQEEFAKSLGLTQGGYSDIERGKNAVSPKIKLLLVSVHKVNMAWFENGEGEMFILELPPDDEIPPIQSIETLEKPMDTQGTQLAQLNSEILRLKAEQRLYLELLSAKDKTISVLEEQLKELKAKN